jgi:phosphatidylserine/phosphatidylglycerophosphate/cardiolipin synthase-like enzyme
VSWSQTPGLTGAGVALALRVGLAVRHAAGVIHELLCDARERILLVSFAAYTLPEIAVDLRASAERGRQTDIVFESTADNPGYDGPAHQYSDIPGVTRWHWPKDQRTPGASLHAKLLVIDGRRALVGSANLTSRALDSNIEAGVLISNPDLAASLEQRVRQLMCDRAFQQATD